MAFELPALPYAFNALEPHIDARTMEIHHDKHHAAYTTNLNNALKDYPDLQSKSIEQLLQSLDSVPEAIRPAVRNNGGGFANHNLFWQIMGPGNGGEPTGDLDQATAASLGLVRTGADSHAIADATSRQIAADISRKATATVAELRDQARCACGGYSIQASAGGTRPGLAASSAGLFEGSHLV